MPIISIILVTILTALLFLLKLNLVKIKGRIGEAKVKKIIQRLGSEYISIHDIMLKNNKGFTSQIDHIILSRYGIFVIETKNYKGWVFGNEKSENWTQVVYKEKHLFRNPVKQNWSHIYALKDLLSEFQNIRYFSIIVFTGSAVLKDIESSVPVIYETHLKQTIKKLSASECITDEQIVNIKKLIESSNIVEKHRNRTHIQNVRQNAIERQLKMENLICPNCNSELKLRNGRNGKFYGCSNYPYCKFTMPY